MEFQEDFYPSEVDRLVLGHLQETEASFSFQVFLAESVNLKEHYNHLVLQNKWRSLTVNGKTLKQILSAYCRLSRQNITEINESASRMRRDLSKVASKEKILCNKCVQTEPLSTSGTEFIEDDDVAASSVRSANEKRSIYDYNRMLQTSLEVIRELNDKLQKCLDKIAKCEGVTVENLHETLQLLQQLGTKLSEDSCSIESKHASTEAILKKLGNEVFSVEENLSNILSVPEMLKACETNPAISDDWNNMSKKNAIQSVCYKNISAENIAVENIVEHCRNNIVVEEKAENDVQQKSKFTENRTTGNQSTATLQDLAATGLVNSVDVSTSVTLINSSSINTFQSNLRLYPTLNPGRFFNLQEVFLPDSSLQYYSLESCLNFLKSVSARSSARQAAENTVNTDNEESKTINICHLSEFLESQPLVERSVWFSQKKLTADEVQAKRMGLKEAMEEWKKKENSARNAENKCSSSMPGYIGSSTLQGIGCQQKDIMQLKGNSDFGEKVSPSKKIVSNLVPENSTVSEVNKKGNRNMSKKGRRKYRKRKTKPLLKASNISHTESQSINFSPKSPISETIENVIKAYSVDDTPNDNTFANVSPNKEKSTINKTAEKSSGCKDTLSNKINLTAEVSKEEVACEKCVVVIERLSPDQLAKAMYPSTTKEAVEEVLIHSPAKELSSISKVSENDISFDASHITFSPSPCLTNFDINSKTNLLGISESQEESNLAEGCKKPSEVLIHSPAKELSSISKVSENDISFDASHITFSPSPCLTNFDINSKTNLLGISESQEESNLAEGCKKPSEVLIHSPAKELSSISKVSENDISFDASHITFSPSPCLTNFDINSKTNLLGISESQEESNLEEGCKKGSTKGKVCSRNLEQNARDNEKKLKVKYLRAKTHKFWSCRNSFKRSNGKTAVWSNNRLKPANKKNSLILYYIKLKSKMFSKYSSSKKLISTSENKITKDENSHSTFDKDNKNTSTPSQGHTSKHKCSPLDAPSQKKQKLTDKICTVSPSSNIGQGCSLSQCLPEYSVISENALVKVADAQHQVVSDIVPRKPVSSSDNHVVPEHVTPALPTLFELNRNLIKSNQNSDQPSPLDLSSPNQPVNKEHISVSTPPSYKREKGVALRQSPRFKKHSVSEVPPSRVSKLMLSYENVSEDHNQLTSCESKNVYFADLAKNKPASIKHATYSHPNILNGMQTSPKIDKSTLSNLTRQAYPVHNKPYHLKNFYSYPMISQSCVSPASLPHCIRDEIPIPLGRSACFKNPIQYDGPVYEFGSPPTKANQPQWKIVTHKKTSLALNSKVNTDHQLNVSTSNCHSPLHHNKYHNSNFDNICNMPLPRSPCAEMNERELTCETPYAIKEELVDVNSDRTVDLVSEDEEVAERSIEVEMNKLHEDYSMLKKLSSQLESWDDSDDSSQDSKLDMEVDLETEKDDKEEDFNEMEIVPNASVEEGAYAFLSPECEMKDGNLSPNRDQEDDEFKTLEMLLRKNYKNVSPEKLEGILLHSKKHNLAAELVTELKKQEQSTNQD